MKWSFLMTYIFDFKEKNIYLFICKCNPLFNKLVHTIQLMFLL